jgi:hypothetical protein
MSLTTSMPTLRRAARVGIGKATRDAVRIGRRAEPGAPMTAFTRLPDQFTVRIAGALLAEFAGPAPCRVLREWWHSAESPG